MAKKIITILMATLLIFSLVACGNTTQQTKKSSTQTGKKTEDNTSEAETTKEIAGEYTSESTGTEVIEKNGKALVVYFSWSTSGNTEKMATYIQSKTGADILELTPANPYPDDYSQTADVAKAERDENARPEISNLPDSISEYDSIFVCYPIWWHTAPMIIGTFLNNYDMTGVDIYPVSQSASMDKEQFDNSMNFVRENAKGANVHEGLFTQAENTDEIMKYLAENGFDK